ncbi:uncharacterized protein DSM5745_01303 [Aspergillus mulundensis]|uniref:Uncharacterized protein n=1 Tax=Aspergillus mulundensis TaxID=1810919 RepID=A0A3D8T6B6_9EURO|nr:hypothetical protein DSM5745_01303 [Aspergillus mulundensis]RDW93981.1 hypothetical protein DSM5745_01303 [Aspergillus mulundensis]
MAPLEFLQTTLVNGTENPVYILFPPAPPLEIPANKALKEYSAKIDEIFVYDDDEEAEDCYTLKAPLALGPESHVTIVEEPSGLVLMYRHKDSHVEQRTPLERTSGGHQLHNEVETHPLEPTTELHHLLGIADEHARDAVTNLNAGDASELTSSRDAFMSMFAGPVQVEPTPKALGGGPTTSAIGGAPTPTTGPPPTSGTPPSSANVTIVSNAALNDPLLGAATVKAYEDMQSLMSVIMLLASFALEDKSRELKRKISPIDDTALWMKTAADAYLKAPFDPLLAGILIASSMGGNTINRTCLRSEVHANFLHEFAKDFAVDPDAYKTLDKMLTEFTRSIANGNISQSQQVNFAMATPWIPINKIPGSAFSMVMPRLKVYYISAASSTFTEIVRQGKSSTSVEKVNLRFQYNCQICDLNAAVWNGKKAQFDAGLQAITGRNFANLQGGVGQTVIVP